MLPEGFPKWRSVHAYFQIWSEERDGQPSSLETVLKKLVGVVRTTNGRTENTSFLIIDAQSVKNTDTAREKGYDAGKKVSGIKRHIAVDTNGLPHAVHVTTANATDRTGAVTMVMKEQGHLVQVERVLVDASYTGKPFAEAIQATIGAAVEVVKRSELHTFKLMPKRWVVERSFSWLEKCRRLWKNCEHTLNTSLQMMVLAFVALLLRRL
jgi:transposase